MHKIQAFKITLSFKTDVTKEMQKWILGYLQRQTLYRYIVTELDKSGKVHLHACCIWNKETRGDNIKETLWKYGYMKCQKDQSNKKFCIMVNVLYDDNWYQEYLSKDPNRIVLDNVWGEPDDIKQYYPSKEVQEDCQRIGEATKSRNANIDMCEDFQRWVDERQIGYNDGFAAAEWLKRWHTDRRLLIDPRIFKQKWNLLMNVTWNKWRIEEWMKKMCNDRGCYSGGGDVSLREHGCTVFKDPMVSEGEDANHELFSQTEGELAGSSQLQQEIEVEPVHEQAQVNEEASCESTEEI
jgi:hypothetical protein